MFHVRKISQKTWKCRGHSKHEFARNIRFFDNSHLACFDLSCWKSSSITALKMKIPLRISSVNVTKEKLNFLYNVCAYCYVLNSVFLPPPSSKRVISAKTIFERDNIFIIGIYKRWNLVNITLNNSLSLSRITFIFLTHPKPVLYFYTPWRHQKTRGFLKFSGGIEIEH